MIELNYIDTGFGSKLIDFTQYPFDNIDYQETIEFGFGNNMFEIDSFGTAIATLNNEEASILPGQEPSTSLGSYTVSFSHTGLQYKSADDLITFSTGTTTLDDDYFSRVEGETNAFPPITATVSYLNYTTSQFLRIIWSTSSGAEYNTTFLATGGSISTTYNLNVILSYLGIATLRNNIQLYISSSDLSVEDGSVFNITSNYNDNNKVVAVYTDKDGNRQTSDPLSIPTNGIVNLNDFSLSGSSLFTYDPKINIDFDSDGDIGTDTSNITLTVESEYVNSKCTNFGSKKLDLREPLKKNIVKYEYEDIFERGQISLNKNSTGEISIKNKNILIPVLSCKAFISGLASDVTINIEKIATRRFNVFNPSNKNIQAKYTASFRNTKKTKIYHDQKEVDFNNKNIADYASSYEIILVPKFETIDTKKIDLMNTYGGDYVETGNLTLDIEHNFVLDRIGTTGSYIIPYVKPEPEASFFSLHMPTIEEVIEITGFAESSIVDTDGALLSDIIIKTTGSTVILYKTDSPDDETDLSSTFDIRTRETGFSHLPPYRVYLELGTSYYFWYSKNVMGPDNSFGPPGAWLYSTIRFPNVITYN